MQLSRKNIIIAVCVIVPVIMLASNPSRRRYMDTKLDNDTFVQEIAKSVCRTNSIRSSSSYLRDSIESCALEVARDRSTIERFANQNYKRADALGGLFSIHELSLRETEAITTEITDIGVLGFFINLGFIYLLGIFMVFAFIAVLIVISFRPKAWHSTEEDNIK